MDTEEFRKRTMGFALQVIDYTEALPNTLTALRIGDQLLRAGMSVGANYRAACRAKSPADFISKMGTVEEEADEAAFWLEVLQRKKIGNQNTAKSLSREADELTALVVASIKTAKLNSRG